ncbi:MAG: hypothetical protein ACRD6B_25380 [Bryobacteraceae bacterium]
MTSTIYVATTAATSAVNQLRYDFSRDYKWSIASLTAGGFVLGLMLGFVLRWYW